VGVRRRNPLTPRRRNEERIQEKNKKKTRTALLRPHVLQGHYKMASEGKEKMAPLGGN